MPRQLDEYRVYLIRERIRCGHTNVEIAREIGISRQCVSHYRDMIRKEALGRPRPEYDTTHDKRYFESDEQAAKFAELLDGMTFDTIKTKSYGKVGRPNPTFVMSESNLARCG